MVGGSLIPRLSCVGGHKSLGTRLGGRVHGGKGTSTIESLPAPAMPLTTLVETYPPSASNLSIMFWYHVKIGP